MTERDPIEVGTERRPMECALTQEERIQRSNHGATREVATEQRLKLNEAIRAAPPSMWYPGDEAWDGTGTKEVVDVQP